MFVFLGTGLLLLVLLVVRDPLPVVLLIVFREIRTWEKRKRALSLKEPAHPGVFEEVDFLNVVTFLAVDRVF